MKKRVLTLMFAVISLCVASVPVSANDVATITPCYEGIASATVTIVISREGLTDGLTSNVVRVQVLPGYTADVYLTLQQKVGRWEDVYTWETSGSSRVYMNKPYYVESGYYYRAVASIEIYDEYDNYVETISVESLPEYY